MVVSFWTMYEGDENFFIFEALDAKILAKLSRAKAAILPPFAPSELYFFFKNQEIPVFPNLELKFKFPGKIGALLLFKSLNLPHPKSVVIPRLCGIEENPYRSFEKPVFPFVVKGNHGDEGSEVFLVRDEEDFKEVLNRIKAWERQGRYGFILQEYIPTGFDARVIVIGKERLIFFREGGFLKNLVQEGKTIAPPSKKLKQKALMLVENFLEKTKLNHVAIDLLFKEDLEDEAKFKPLLSELNYTFGRRLIGEKEYERLVRSAIEEFLKEQGL